MLQKWQGCGNAQSSFLCNSVLFGGAFSWFKRGIEALEFDARINRREAPVDRDSLLIAALLPVNSSEKLPTSATPKVSRGGEFSIGICECQSKNPQNVCSLKQGPSFVI